MILQVENIDLNRVMDITPYNTLSYGALLLLLIIIVYVLYKKIQELEKYNQGLVERIHTLADNIKEKLDQIKEHDQTKQQNIVEILRDVMRKLDTLYNHHER